MPTDAAEPWNFDEYEALVHRVYRAHLGRGGFREWRLGQSYSNVLHTVRPDLNDVIGEGVFYRDDLIPEFVAKLRALLGAATTPTARRFVEHRLTDGTLCIVEGLHRDTECSTSTPVPDAHDAFCDGSCKAGAHQCPDQTATPTPDPAEEDESAGRALFRPEGEIFASDTWLCGHIDNGRLCFVTLTPADLVCRLHGKRLPPEPAEET